jgi:hypothetical protein
MSRSIVWINRRAGVAEELCVPEITIQRQNAKSVRASEEIIYLSPLPAKQ